VFAEAITAVAVARSPTGNHRKDRTGGANVSTVPAVIERAILGNAKRRFSCMYVPATPLKNIDAIEALYITNALERQQSQPSVKIKSCYGY